MSRLDIGLFPGRVLDVPADTLVVILPLDERPLRGEAGLVDWRLCGQISHQLKSGYATGASGEVVLLPAGPALRAGRVLLVGSGPGEGLSRRPLLRATRTAADRLLALHSRAAAIALPGAVELERDGVSLLRGLVHGLAAGPPHAELHVILAEAERRERALLTALSEVYPAAQSWGIGIDARWLEADEVAAEVPEPAA